MHSITVSLTACVLATFELLGFGFPAGFAAGMLALAVAVIGIPHGAADHLKGRELLSPVFGGSWGAVFATTYLAIGGVVLVGWYAAPVATALGFFAISAWHFGWEDRDSTGPGQWSALRAIACGGLVIWVPCTFQSARVQSLLVTISDSLTPVQAATIVGIVTGLAPCFGCLVILDSKFELQSLRAQAAWRAPQLLGTATWRYLTFGWLFAVADPLLSFGVYFCGWHSIRGLRSLQRELGVTRWKLVRLLAPLTGLTLLLISAGWMVGSSGLGVSQHTIRILFLGLSAIAVPHLLLELCGELRAAGRWRVAGTETGAAS